MKNALFVFLSLDSLTWYDDLQLHQFSCKLYVLLDLTWTYCFLLSHYMNISIFLPKLMSIHVT